MKTSWTNPPVIPVTVVVNCQPAVMVIPSYITLMPGPLPNAITNSVAIQNNSTNLLTLSDPVVNVPGVEAQIKETQPGKAFAAMLAFPQGFQITPGQQVELSLKTSHPKFPTVKVPVVQMPRPQAPAPPTPPPPVVAPAPAGAPASPAPAALPTPSLPPAPVKQASTFPRRPSAPPPLPQGLNTRSAVTVIPARIRLAPGPLPNAVTNSVVILNNSTNLLHLSEPVLNAPGVQTQIRETQPGKSFSVMMAFPQGFQITPGQHVELSVSTSDPKFPVVKVPVKQLPQPPVAVQPAPSVPPGPVVAPTPPVAPTAPDKAGIRLPAEGAY
jgi:nitrate reductase NapAB chaperone NapD